MSGQDSATLNYLLRGLPDEATAGVSSKLNSVELPLGELLYEQGERLMPSIFPFRG